MSPTAQETHPQLEEIAAFIDGRLTAGDRERLTAHLADCADCYEVFSATGRTVLDLRASESGGAAPAAEPGRDGKLLRPRPGRWRRRALLALPAVAAASLLVIFFLPGRADRLRVEALTGSLSDSAAVADRVAASWKDHGWGLQRGTAEPLGPDEELAFQLGVRVMEVDLALSAGAPELAAHLGDEVARLAAGVPDSNDLLLIYGGEMGISGQLAAGRPPRELLLLSRRGDEWLGAEPEAGREPGVDPFWYRLGKWARAAQLAAASGDGAYLARRQHREFLEQALAGPAPPEIAARLRRTRQLLGADDERTLPQVERELADLIAVAGGGRPPADGAPRAPAG